MFITNTLTHLLIIFFFLFNQANSEPILKEAAPSAAPPLPLIAVFAVPKYTHEENKRTFRENNYWSLINYFHLKGYEMYQCSLGRGKLHRSG